MSIAASHRAGALLVSAAVWAALVAAAFTTGLRLPEIDLAPPNEDRIDVVTEVKPLPPPVPPKDPPKTDQRLRESEEIALTPLPVPPLPSPPAPFAPAATAVAPPAPAIVRPQWLSRPGAREFERFYPARARDRGKEGRVTLDCIVAADGAIGCRIVQETPEGWGFGQAALKIAPAFRIAPQMEDGRPTAGGTVRVDLNFRLDG
jgi:protein TonB